MSQRNIRKLYGGVQLPPPGDSTDEEFQPAFAQKTKKSCYAGLEISSCSEGNASEGDKEVIPEKPKPEQTKKKRHRKKKKQPKVKDELDEIDRTVKEINAVLGEPKMPEIIVPEKDVDKLQKRLFTVRQQNLDVKNELFKMFGPDEEGEPKKHGRLRTIAHKGFIIPTNTIYKKKGLGMVLRERKDEFKYYVFEHSRNYQKMHSSFLFAQKQTLMEGAPRLIFPLEESQHRMHVEGLLELADRAYVIEEYTRGNKVIEEIIDYMQFCAHPFFSVTDIRTRLEYRNVENRPFHIALFKYMHMMTNKACHRTALELAKLLLNLDPSDPLAVLFIIDTIAIRAREYEWLVEAIEFWKEDRDAGFLFNMQYSYALATFHIARKIKVKAKKRPKYMSLKAATKNFTKIFKASVSKRKKRVNLKNGYFGRPIVPVGDVTVGFEKADQLIQEALIKFPTVLTNIMKHAGIRNAKIKECSLFSMEANNGMPAKLKDLIYLYSRFIWNKFSEESVMKWIVRNAEIVVDKYHTDSSTQRLAKVHANVRMNLFQTYPSEIIRHLSIITPLNNLIVDGAVPNIGRVVSYDPAPPFNGINNYERSLTNEGDDEDYFEIFTSTPPEHELQDASMEHRLDFSDNLQAILQNEDPLQHPVLTDDFETETESDDDSAAESPDNNTMEPQPQEEPVDVVGLFRELYDNRYARQRRVPRNEPIDSSSDEDMTNGSRSILQEPPTVSTRRSADSDVESLDSDDDSESLIMTMTLPIRNGAQYYRDLSGVIGPRQSIQVPQPIEIAPEIDLNSVQQGEHAEDHTETDKTTSDSTKCCYSTDDEEELESDVEEEDIKKDDHVQPVQNELPNQYDEFDQNKTHEVLEVIEIEDDYMSIDNDDENNIDRMRQNYDLEQNFYRSSAIVCTSNGMKLEDDNKEDNRNEQLDHEEPRAPQEEPPPQYDEFPENEGYDYVDDIEDDDDDDMGDDESNNESDNSDGENSGSDNNDDDQSDEGEEENNGEDGEDDDEDDGDEDDGDEDDDDDDNHYDDDNSNSISIGRVGNELYLEIRHSMLESNEQGNVICLCRFRVLFPVTHVLQQQQQELQAQQEQQEQNQQEQQGQAQSQANQPNAAVAISSQPLEINDDVE